MKKKELEISLQRIPSHPKPKPDLEQYTTPANIAADILFNAYALGDIGGKSVIDLGCGTGIFAIGAKLLSAKEVVGVDVDKVAISVARKIAREFKINVDFQISEIKDFKGKADTVLQNPPFGSQKRGADVPFIHKALELAPVVYTIHLSKTINFVRRIIEDLNAIITYEKKYRFEIRHMFKFHRREKEWMDTTMLRIERINKNKR